MSKKGLERTGPYSIDLTKIDGDGSFPCPKCGNVISPEDESEETYKIASTKVVNDQLVELVVECSNCRTVIRLTGFEAAIEGVTNE
jgi:predicted nucleic-acid-binding Zn-ribbon protein